MPTPNIITGTVGQPLAETLIELNITKDLWVNIPKNHIQEMRLELGCGLGKENKVRS